MNARKLRKKVPTFLIAAAISVSANANETLRVANWSNYIDPSLVERFQSESGIKVEYSTYSTDAEADALLHASEPPDLLVRDAFRLDMAIKDKTLQSFKTTEIAGYSDMLPMVDARIKGLKGVKDFVFPYSWGRTGLIVNRSVVSEALGSPMPHSWSLVFDPATTSKLATCGVSVLDSGNDVYNAYMAYSGSNPELPTTKAFKGMSDTLSALSHQVSPNSTSYIDQLKTGKACVAMAWEGDARRLLAEQPELEFILPQEGATMYVDSFVVPATAKNLASAIKFIEFISSPEVAASNTAAVKFLTPFVSVEGAMAQADPSFDAWMTQLKSSDNGRAHAVNIRNPATQTAINEAWEAFKASHGSKANPEPVTETAQPQTANTTDKGKASTKS